MREAAAVGLGLVGAALAQLIALGLAGAGHGWITPFFASMGLWVLIPVGLYVSSPLKGYPASRRNFLISILMIGLFADASLVWFTVREGAHYFRTMLDLAPGVCIAWILLFVGWQVPVAVTLATGVREGVE